MAVFSLPPIPPNLSDTLVLHQWLFEVFKDIENAIIKGTTSVTTAYTIVAKDEVIFGNTDGGAVTVTLPVGKEGATFKIINSGSSGNSLIVAPDGTEHLIGENSNFTLLDGETLIVTYNVSDGWY